MDEYTHSVTFERGCGSLGTPWAPRHRPGCGAALTLSRSLSVLTSPSLRTASSSSHFYLSRMPSDLDKFVSLSALIFAVLVLTLAFTSTFSAPPTDRSSSSSAASPSQRSKSNASASKPARSSSKRPTFRS